jgi:hypothetical protein
MSKVVRTHPCTKPNDRFDTYEIHTLRRIQAPRPLVSAGPVRPDFFCDIGVVEQGVKLWHVKVTIFRSRARTTRHSR